MEHKSIGVFIDGGYYAKINEGFKAKGMGINVNVKALFSYIPEMIGKQFGIDRKHLYITEAHYYRGRYRTHDAIERNLLKSEREFEDTLIENDIIFHYKHLREVNDHGHTTVIEKGIDTWFALDTYEMAQYRDFDYTVLISGDADHEMLARKLRALKTHVILLTWDPDNSGSTSRFLREEVCTHIDLNKLTANDATLLQKISRTA